MSKLKTLNTDNVLTEIVFMLPETTPDGELREDIHEEVEGEILKKFGNYTVSLGDFAVKVEEELVHDDVLIYTIILPNSKVYIDAAKEIATSFAKKLEQDFVYFKTANGEVLFLDT